MSTFECFGGVTAEVLVNHQKIEIISHRSGAAVEFNPPFLRAQHICGVYDIRPRAGGPIESRTQRQTRTHS
jgi:transposase